MAIVSRRYGYLFLHAPLTGGTALAKGVLVPHLAGEWLPAEHIEVMDTHGPRVLRQHITKAQLVDNGLLDAEEAAALLTFTTVRNPFDAVVSSYVKKREVVPGRQWVDRHPVTKARVEAAARLPFPEYVVATYGDRKPRHFQRRHLRGTDVVLRFEHLQDDFDALCERLGVGWKIPIPRRNVTPRDRDHRSYYTPEARAVVERVFAPDLERFGYCF